MSPEPAADLPPVGLPEARPDLLAELDPAVDPHLALAELMTQWHDIAVPPRPSRRQRVERGLRWMRRVVPVVLLLSLVEWRLVGDPTDHVLDAGGVAVPVQAFRNPFRAVAAIGYDPRLALVGDGRCLGSHWDDGTEVVLVWPSGTRVSGSGRRLEVIYHGRTWHLGDTVYGGSDQSGFPDAGDAFPGLAATLPESCRGLPMTDVEPGQ